MESADLKPDSPDDAQIDSLLRATLTAPPLSDDGFSDRVLIALPSPAPAPKPSLRPWICIGGAMIGTALAAFSFSHGGGPNPSAQVEQFAQLLTSFRTSFAPLADGPVLLGLVATIVSLAFVYWREIAAKLVR